MSRRKRKPSKGKTINPNFFIFCEGDTEELYVKFLKSQYRVPIEVDSKISGNRITKKYITNYKKGKYIHKKDKTFLLYDLDAPKILEKLQAINDTILLVSNPCIELWYLLHYKEQKAEINCKRCISDLTNRNKTYSKTILDKKLKQNLLDKQDKAIDRAKRLTKYSNPSSTINILIEELKSAQKEKI